MASPHPTPQLQKYPVLNKFEQTTSVPKAYAAIGAFGLFTTVSITICTFASEV